MVGAFSPNRHRRLTGLAVGVVLTIAVAACSSGSSASAATSVKTVTIGELQDLSGNCSAPGIPTSKGVALAVKNINAHPFTVAGQKYKLKLDTRDTAGDNTTAVNALISLVNDDNVKMIVGPGCGAYIEPGLGPLAVKDKIILFNPYPSAKLDSTKTASAFAKGPGYLLPAAQASSSQSGTAQASLVSLFPNPSSIKKISLLLENDAEGHNFGSALQAYYNTHGYTTSLTYYPTNTQDFSGFLSQVKSSNPGLLVYGYGDPSGLAILKQAVAVNAAPRYYGYGTAITDATGVNGTTGITSPQISLEYVRSLAYPDTSQLKSFAAQYSAANGGSLGADSSYATYLYDDPGLLVAAMKKAGTTTNLNSIAKALYGIKYSGLDSPSEYFDSTHHLHFQVDGCYVPPGANPTQNVKCSPVKQ